ncbi:hypothetical protein MITS9509_03170 [Synechococcus sp. MIT S9509]|uniref:hypothetical protein n=1 Tax=unclassified Synechococcus TaxID=2626047 RepID=UPI0007BB8491|nr:MULTISPECIES: hypothetical protein [unclassified Synechococcus]KZR84099.1 hypothetical protein MITS9504_03076 [Synechococcus sp. MIT S9504]KZR88844.1 hypothetical protein MITS9509_03170 [Synechococcus sp. MIT S9509]
MAFRFRQRADRDSPYEVDIRIGPLMSDQHDSQEMTPTAAALAVLPPAIAELLAIRSNLSHEVHSVAHEVIQFSTDIDDIGVASRSGSFIAMLGSCSRELFNPRAGDVESMCWFWAS